MGARVVNHVRFVLGWIECRSGTQGTGERPDNFKLGRLGKDKSK